MNITDYSQHYCCLPVNCRDRHFRHFQFHLTALANSFVIIVTFAKLVTIVRLSQTEDTGRGIDEEMYARCTVRARRQLHR